MSAPESIRIVTASVPRFEIAVDAPYPDFRARYESEVPQFRPEDVHKLLAEDAPWEAFVTSAAAAAPNNFLIYWSFDPTALMNRAGPARAGVEYLMGNHVIAAEMYRIHPGVALYAPLRTAIYDDADGRARFTFDQPSSRFSTFGDPRIDAVGRELDHHVAELLRVLDVPVPAQLIE